MVSEKVVRVMVAVRVYLLARVGCDCFYKRLSESF